MPKEKNKSKFVGMRLSEEQNQALSRLQKDSKTSKSDVLLRGLELLGEYYSLGLDKPPLNFDLKSLESEAMHLAKTLRQIQDKKQAVRQMVQELAEVDKILDKHHGQKSALIQVLLDIQAQNHWLPKPALIWVSERLDVPLSWIYHIATFYKAFSLVPQGRHVIQVCLGTACQVRGTRRLLDNVVSVLGIEPGQTDSEQKFTLTTVNCLGCCALGPVMKVDGQYYSKPGIQDIKKIAASCD
jgi:NADH-quinone oxidoreductase subunit E